MIDFDKVNKTIKKLQLGGTMNGLSPIRIPFSNYKKGVYNTVDPTTDIPEWWQTIGMGIASWLKGFSKNPSKDMKIKNQLLMLHGQKD